MCQPLSIHKEVTLELCMPPHKGAEVPSEDQNWHPEQDCACAIFPPPSAQLILHTERANEVSVNPDQTSHFPGTLRDHRIN